MDNPIFFVKSILKKANENNASREEILSAISVFRNQIEPNDELIAELGILSRTIIPDLEIALNNLL